MALTLFKKFAKQKYTRQNIKKYIKDKGIECDRDILEEWLNSGILDKISSYDNDDNVLSSDDIF